MEPFDQLPTEETKPRWKAIKLIYFREMRDQLRDRRTVFTIAVLPIALYPLVGMLLMQVAQFGQQSQPRLAVIGASNLPSEPALMDGENLAEPWREAVGPVKLALDVPQVAIEDRPTTLQNWIRDGIYDAVIIIPDSLRSEREATSVQLFYNVTNDRSLVAKDRAERLLSKLREEVVRLGLQQKGVDVSILEPFTVKSENVAPPSASQAAFWSKLLPFVMLVWALTGAFYPAIDLVAGEKERGTLETLLCSPAMRGEIVWGKLLAVATFSMATALLNVAGLELTMSFVSRQLSVGPLGSAGMPPIATLGWLILALIPLSGLFSALALSVAAMARSSKEAQYYLMPLLMVLMPLVILPLLRGIELNIGTAIIPVTGMFLLVRSLVEQQYLVALGHLPIVAAVTAGCCMLAMRWARSQFESEQVLFRSDDQWTFGLWMRRMLQDRQDIPSPAQAFGCGILVLMLLFLGRMSVGKMPSSWNEVVVTVLAPQLGLILFPVLLLSIFFTTSIRSSLRIRRGPWLAYPAAIALAVLANPAYQALAELVKTVYPLGEESLASLGGIDALFREPPFWQAALVLAILPAVCEEICFRGYAMAGLLRIGRPYVAVCITAALFGMSHGILQQSLTATAMGIVLGIIAWKTGSVLPSILFHATHNSLTLWLGRLSSEHATFEGAGKWLFHTTENGVEYRTTWTLLASALAVALLFYFLKLKRTAAVASLANPSLNASDSSA